MGHNADWIPTRELEFKAWVNNFITKLSVYKTTLEITNQTFEQLQTEFTAYQQFESLITGGDNKHQNIVNRNNARDLLKAHIRAVTAQNIRSNPAAHTGILADLLLPIPATKHTPRHIPKNVYPGFSIDFSVSGRHFIHFGTWYEDTKLKFVKGKPDYADFIEIVRFIGGEEAPLIEDMKPVALQSKSPVEFIYTLDMVGVRVWYACRWRNTKGEAGIWSDIHSAIIN